LISHITSDQTARRLFFLFDYHWLYLFLNHHSHRLVKDILQSILCQSTTLHIFALKFLLYQLSCCLFHNRCFLWIFLYYRIFVSQINLISDKYFRNIPYVFLQLWVPLNRWFITFFRALIKEDGSITEKTMRKTSQWG
jgi:hypothetical protein